MSDPSTILSSLSEFIDAAHVSDILKKIEDEIGDMTCLICMNIPDIPVILKENCGGECCFGKKKQLFCLTCTRDYFNLNTPKSERTYTLKHIICSKRVNPQHLNAEKTYTVKDGYVFDILDKKHPESIYCRRCEMRFKSRIELRSHQVAECSKRSVKCTFCDYMSIPNDLLEHFQSGSCRYYRSMHTRRISEFSGGFESEYPPTVEIHRPGNDTAESEALGRMASISVSGSEQTPRRIHSRPR